MLPNGCFRFPFGDKSPVNPHCVWSYQFLVELLDNTQNTDSHLLQMSPCRLGTSILDLQTVLGSSALEGNSLIAFTGTRLCLWTDILLSGYILNNRIILNAVISVLSFKALSSYWGDCWTTPKNSSILLIYFVNNIYLERKAQLLWQWQ